MYNKRTVSILALSIRPECRYVDTISNMRLVAEAQPWWLTARATSSTELICGLKLMISSIARSQILVISFCAEMDRMIFHHGRVIMRSLCMLNAKCRPELGP